jgi:hypothetical protein
MTDNDSKIIGHLFGTIGYKSDVHLRNLIDELTPEQSIFFINRAIEYCYSKGSFSLVESEIISKSLFFVNSNFNKSSETKKENE